MKKFISILKNTSLFSGVNENEIEAMLSCLGAQYRTYPKGAYIFRRGNQLQRIMILAEGCLHIQKDDYWGNRSILAHISPGEMFGEAYIAPQSGPILNDVIAVENSAVLFFDVKKLITTCPSVCPFHAKVVENMFFAISEKNRRLVQKLGHMCERTTREKLISYLSEEAEKQKSASFTIPFNRQQLADFLSVDRSAMSNELCKMRDEGLIRFHKNAFVLLS